MSDEKRFYKVSAVVDQFLIENELPNGWFPKGLAYALRGLRELNLDTWADIKTVLLDVTDRKTCVLPADFVDWCKVGVQYQQYVIAIGANAELGTLKREPNATHAAGLPGDFGPNGINFSSYSPMPFANYNGTSVNAFGGSFVTKGSFKVHDSGACKELLMDYSYGFEKVYLEYITDGFDPCSETYIHPYIYDYLCKYVDAKYEDKNNPEGTESSIQRRWADVHFAERKVRARKNNLDPTTLLNITRESTKLSIKM